MKSLHATLYDATTPFENDSWRRCDCIIRLYDNDIACVQYPDGSSTFFIHKNGEWVDSNQLAPTELM